MQQLSQLLGTTLMLVAHPDDEVIAFGGLMQHMKKAMVVFATDGAPRDRRFWKDHDSREIYAAVRRQEAREALGIVGVQPVFLAEEVSGGLADQELFRRLPEAIKAFDELISRIAPDCLLTLGYEGGHPDHDACCFIASQVGRSRTLPVWESPLYHRHADGSLALQMFPKRTGQEIDFEVKGEPFLKKLEMFHTYKSQRLVLDGFRPETEQFRPLMDYDFSRRPLPWKLNYEVWEWAMNGDEVAREFASYLSGRNS